MMLTPCWPSAGPTGGAGVAFPASICSLTIALTFFATNPPVRRHSVGNGPGLAPARLCRWRLSDRRLRDPSDLQEVQLHGRLSSEEGDQHAHLPLLGVDVVHHADEVGEGAVDDLDPFPAREGHLDLRRLHLHLLKDPFDLGILERGGARPGSHETRHARRVADDVPGVVAHHHLDQHVTREHLTLHGSPLAVLDLDLPLGRDDDLEDLVADAHRVDAVLEIRLDLVLVTGVRVDHVPLAVLVLDRGALLVASNEGFALAVDGQRLGVQLVVERSLVRLLDGLRTALRWTHCNNQVMNAENMASTMPRKNPTITDSTTTTMVNLSASSRVGQTTLRSSDRTSRTHVVMPRVRPSSSAAAAGGSGFRGVGRRAGAVLLAAGCRRSATGPDFRSCGFATIATVHTERNRRASVSSEWRRAPARPCLHYKVGESRDSGHARQDSNPQPAVLETAALPVELRAY